MVEKLLMLVLKVQVVCLYAVFAWMLALVFGGFFYAHVLN